MLKTGAKPSKFLPAFGGALVVGFSIFCICVLAVPSLEAPLNDDWCYAYIAKVFAQTGRITFAGCSAATLGIQTLSGAFVIKLLGFSFRTLRMLMAASAGACATIQYLLMRKLQISERNAIFGAFAIMLSPVVFPNSIMFMTDVPALLFVSLSLLLALIGLTSNSRTKLLSLLLASFAASLCAASIRQFFFLLPICLFGAIAYLRRRDRLISVVSGAILAGSILCLLLTLHWYSTQEHVATRAGSILTSITAVAHPFGFIKACSRMALSVAMYLTPITAAFLLPVRRNIKWIAIGVGLGILVAIVRPLPELGNMVTPNGFLSDGQTLIGVRPVVLGSGSRLLITLVTMAASSRASWALFRNAELAWKNGLSSTKLFSRCVGPFLLVYTLAVASRYPWGLFDRYLIPVIAILAVVLLSIYEAPVPIVCWILASLFLAFEWAAVHDYIAEYSARMQVVAQLLRAGVPRNEISAGLEADSWVQVEQAGTIDYPEQPLLKYPAAPFLDALPEIRPRYYVTRSRLNGLKQVDEPICFGQMLPPFHSCVYAVR